jgi:pantoate--beta-alanine ligase
MAQDLNLPVRVVACPIVREADGLAMSSRNVYLDAADRVRAAALHRALTAAEDLVAHGRTRRDMILDVARAELYAAGIQPEYLDLRSPDDLTEVDDAAPAALLAVAARVGAARLIDNTLLETR